MTTGSVIPMQCKLLLRCIPGSKKELRTFAAGRSATTNVTTSETALSSILSAISFVVGKAGQSRLLSSVWGSEAAVIPVRGLPAEPKGGKSGKVQEWT